MLKYIVFLCNFVFFITGCVVIGFGVYLHVQMNDYYNFIDSKYVSSALILMVAGAVIVVVAFFGCCGACTESACMMYTFGFLLSLILMVELGVAITILMFKDDALVILKDQLKKTVDNYKREEGATNAWDAMQMKLHCCGIDSYEDWANLTMIDNDSVPESCCINMVKGCGEGAIKKPDTLYQQGCLDKLKDIVVENAVVVGAVGVGVALIQLVGVCLSCGLAKKMNDFKQYV